jgi:homoserine kinase type II
MAVYTEVGDEELTAFIAEYDLGAVRSCKGIAEGVENSNYMLVTDAGTYILTLYEKRVREADLPFFFRLMDHLAARGVPCPVPVAGRDGGKLRRLSGRPAGVFTFLDGMWPRRVTPEHCAGLGDALARMHLAGADFPMHRPNDLSVAGWRRLFEDVRPHADGVQAGLADVLAAELDFLDGAWPTGLASGVVHADLFPDNVFFRGGRVSGLIDFYFACNDFFSYDLAICLNAWAFEPDNSFNATKARRLLGAYRKVRDFSAEELAALPVLARGAALRFLLTRLYDWVHTPEDALVVPKDPLEYLGKLVFHQAVRGPAAYGLD